MLYKLHPAAHPILRGNGYIQFGLDAKTSGIIGPFNYKQASLIIRISLQMKKRARSKQWCQERLLASGLSPHESHNIIDELIRYGIMITPLEKKPIVICGYMPLVQIIASLLEKHNFRCIIPRIGESTEEFLRAVQRSYPLILVYNGEFIPEVLFHRNSFSDYFIPLSIIDHQTIIGPISKATEGPCILCAELYRRDSDPAWHIIRGQYPTTLEHNATVNLTLAAAHIAALVLHTCSIPPIPGKKSPDIEPGLILTIAADGTSINREVLSVHPGCVYHRNL